MKNGATAPGRVGLPDDIGGGPGHIQAPGPLVISDAENLFIQRRVRRNPLVGFGQVVHVHPRPALGPVAAEHHPACFALLEPSSQVAGMAIAPVQKARPHHHRAPIGKGQHFLLQLHAEVQGMRRVAGSGFIEHGAGHVAANQAARGIHEQALAALGVGRHVAQGLQQPLVGAHGVLKIKHLGDAHVAGGEGGPVGGRLAEVAGQQVNALPVQALRPRRSGAAHQGRDVVAGLAQGFGDGKTGVPAGPGNENVHG